MVWIVNQARNQITQQLQWISAIDRFSVQNSLLQRRRSTVDQLGTMQRPKPCGASDLGRLTFAEPGPQPLQAAQLAGPVKRAGGLTQFDATVAPWPQQSS